MNVKWSELTSFERELINREIRWLENIVASITLFSAFTIVVMYPF